MKRIFISYSHQDKILVEKICKVITSLGYVPLWDEGFAAGRGFHEQIKTFIAHAHIFMPIITPSSNQRGWVHQEIGYAIALNIPVLPVALGALPDEMLREMHAIVLPDSPEKHEHTLRSKLTQGSIETFLAAYLDDMEASYETAPLPEDRAILMARYANQVRQLGKCAMLRQKGGLSSFHIPDNVITDPVWADRYGKNPKSSFHFRCQRNERMALEFHAREAGFKIIIDPRITYKSYGVLARIVRLRTLKNFLDSLTDDKKYQVAFWQGELLYESTTILGDWFYAESIAVTLTTGYRQTIFTRHAPSMQAKIDLFDREFSALLTKSGWRAEESRMRALKEIDRIIRGITATPEK